MSNVEVARRALYKSACEHLEDAKRLMELGEKDAAYRTLREIAMCMTPDSALWEWFGPEMKKVLGL